MQTRLTHLETESLVIGYAMSRLDRAYLAAEGYRTWREAFAGAAKALNVRPNSFKNLRDEFDPIHENSRQGWHGRAMRDDRAHIVDELESVSDEALVELVRRILQRDTEATEEAIESLAEPPHVARNVAERLLTGRRAEEHYVENCERILDVARHELRDDREAMRGYDFAVRRVPEWAVEVKGLKERRGDIQFTDREWTEARSRGADYWLVAVGNLATRPTVRVVQDPHANLAPRCVYQRSVAAAWRTAIAVE